MKVNLIKQQTVLKYAQKHAEARTSCERFICSIGAADWEKPEDIKETFGSVDILGQSSQKAVFDIGGNNHRFICKYRFGKTSVQLFIHWLGTHAEYDELCAKGKQYTAQNFKDYT